MNAPSLILASASPRRRELLQQLGIACQVRPADLAECPLPGEAPEHYVRRIACDKADAVWQATGGSLPVLAADTEVEMEGVIFGKPRDQAHAIELLSALSNREHRVLSSVALRTAGGTGERLSISRVWFRSLSRAEIEAYWHSGEPVGKAGAYAIQGRGAIFIRHLAGSYSGVMGLPLYETAALLAEWGLFQP
jgi:septum formation protein